MPAYLVTIRRTELISFEVEATTADAAEADYLTSGDEVASSTESTETVSVEQADPAV